MQELDRKQVRKCFHQNQVRLTPHSGLTCHIIEEWIGWKAHKNRNLEDDFAKIVMFWSHPHVLSLSYWNQGLWELESRGWEVTNGALVGKTWYERRPWAFIFAKMS